jgi:pimeloyl-ACP methyl ester carboxylesterase
MKRKTRLRLRVLLLTLVVGGGYCALHSYIERFVFNPSAMLTRTPHDVDLPFDHVVVTTSDGINIDGWVILQRPGEDPSPTNSTSPTLLFLHGGGGNMSDCLEKIRLFHDIGLDVFIIDYRGYGKSGGGSSATTRRASTTPSASPRDGPSAGFPW